MAEVIEVSSGEEEEIFQPLNVIFPDVESVSPNKFGELFPDSSSSDSSSSIPGCAELLSQFRNRKRVVSVFILSKMETCMWVSEIVKEFKSKFKTVESINEWRESNRVTYDYDESDIIIEPCWEDDIVCVSRPVGREPEFFFMYEYLFSTFNIFLPFTKFEEEMLKTLNVAPTQLLPNSWGFIKGFEIICTVLDVKPSVGAFFAFHIAKGCDKGGWVYVSSKPQRAILSAYASNYKSWRRKYFRVRPSEDFPELLIDEKGSYKFPIFWEENPTPYWSEKMKISKDEEAVISILEKLAPVSCKKLIEGEFNADKIEKLFLPLMPMKEKEILSYMRRIPAEKMAAAGQQSGAGKRKKHAESTPTSPRGKRQHGGDELASMNEKRKTDNQASGSKQPAIINVEGEPLWKTAVKILEDEFSGMEKKFGEMSLENTKMKKTKEVLTNDVVLLRKDLEKEKKKVNDIKKERAEQVEKLKNDLELETGVANSLKSRLEEKEQEIEELKMEVALQRSLGFENAVDQVKCLYPDLDISLISLFKIVKDGELVEIESVGDEEEESAEKDNEKNETMNEEKTGENGNA